MAKNFVEKYASGLKELRGDTALVVIAVYQIYKGTPIHEVSAKIGMNHCEFVEKLLFAKKMLGVPVGEKKQAREPGFK